MGMDGNMDPVCYLHVHADASIILGSSSTMGTGTGTRTKLLAALSRGDREAAMEMTFLYAPYNMAKSVKFIPDVDVRSMGIDLRVISHSTVDLSDPLIVEGEVPFCYSNSSLNHSSCWGRYRSNGILVP